MTRPLARTIAVLLLPALCGALVLWSLADRTERLDAIPAAVVNLDEMVVIGEGDDAQPVLAGRLLAAELTQPSSPENESLGWTLTDADDAADGLADGSFHAVVVIPEDFSATIAATSSALAGTGGGTGGDGTDLRPATIEVRSNDSASALVGLLSEQIADAAAASLGRTLTTTFLTEALGGFTELGSALGDAADGAQQLADGATGLADGVTALDDGAGALADGIGELAGGADELSAGVAGLSAGAGELAGGIRALSRGADGLADGADDLAVGATGLATGARTFADGVAAAGGDPQGLPAQAGVLAGAADEVAGGVSALADGVAGLAAQCALVSASAEFCAGLTEAAGSAAALAEGATGVAGGVHGVAAGSQQMLAEIAGGAAEVATGAERLAGGTSALASGADDLASGAEGLAAGGRELASGTSALARGAGELADGASSAAGGARDLADGTSALADGVPELAAGAGELATGLAAGAAQVPATDDAAAGLGELLAQPVVAESTRINESPGGATDAAPLVVALGLWIGAFAVFLVREALPRRALVAPVGAARVAWLGFRGAAAWAVAQAAVLAVLLPVFGVSIVSPVAAVLLTGLAALVLVAVVQAVVALWGRTGWVVVVAMFALQAASLGGLVPVETAPPFFQGLHGALPVPMTVDGLTHLTLGGQVGSLGAVVGGLLTWGVAAFAVSALVARSRQRTTVDQLEREAHALAA